MPSFRHRVDPTVRRAGRGTRAGLGRSALTLAVLLAVSACSGAIPGPQPRAKGPLAAATASADPNTQALIDQRRAAGMADCPVPSGTGGPIQHGLPNVSLPCLGSDRWVNLAHLRGTPLLLNLWAQWCPPCRAEAPYLRDFASAAGDTVLVLGVDYNDPHPREALAFAAASGWVYPHVYDADELLGRTMQVPGIPVTLLVNAEGRIVYRHTGGFSSAGQIRQVVAEQLGVGVP